MRKAGYSLIIFLLSCSQTPIVPYSPVKKDYAAVSTYAQWAGQQILKKQNITGLSIAVIDDQDIVWSTGLGYSNREKKYRANVHTLYRTGSISKLFTMATVLKLSESGKLRLDDHLIQHLPSFSMADPKHKDITLRSILSHQSGLPTTTLNGMWYEVKSNYALLPNLKNDYLAFPPNSLYHYSNLAYSLLTISMQEKARDSFDRIVERQLLKPLYMEQSYFAHGRKPTKDLAEPYNSNAQLAAFYQLRDIGAGGLISSVADLSHFVQMIFAEGRYGGQQILRPDSVARMFQRQNSAVEIDYGVETGLAWFLNTRDLHVSGTLASLFGSTINYSGVVLLAKDHKIAVIILANTPAQLGGLVHDLLYRFVHAKNASRDPFQAKVNPMHRTELPAGTSYWAAPQGLITINKFGDKARAEYAGHKLHVYIDSNGYWRMLPKFLNLLPLERGPAAHEYFSFHNLGDKHLILLHGGGKQYRFAQRIKPLRLTDTWVRRLGEYELETEKNALYMDNISISRQGQIILLNYAIAPLNHSSVQHYPIIPVDDKRAVIAGLGRGHGASLHFIESAKEIRFHYSGFVLRKKNTHAKEAATQK